MEPFLMHPQKRMFPVDHLYCNCRPLTVFIPSMPSAGERTPPPLLWTQPQQIGTLRASHRKWTQPVKCVFLVWSNANSRCDDMYAYAFVLFAIYCLIGPRSAKGSVSETPKKSSKKSKESPDDMNKVYDSVLNSVFGAVSSSRPHFGI